MTEILKGEFINVTTLVKRVHTHYKYHLIFTLRRLISGIPEVDIYVFVKRQIVISMYVLPFLILFRL